MAWFEGTASDYQDLLDLIVEYATNDNVQSVVSIDDGGTGFSEGDLVDISGGTGTITAQLEVVSVSSGVVTEARVYNGGAYSSAPSTTQTSLTSTGGSGLDVTITIQSAGWVSRVDRAVFMPQTVTVNAGGSGYSTNDTAQISGGTALRETLLTVTASAGAAASVAIAQRGIYTTAPSSSGAATTSIDGGSGLTVDITFQEQREVILEGSGSGSDEIFAGFRSYAAFSGSSYFNLELAGMTGYNSNEWAAQPGISRGRYDDDANIGGCFLPLRNVSFTYWLSITPSYIKIMALVGTNLASAFNGYIDPSSTPGLAAGLYPAPHLVAGCTTNPFQVATSSVSSSFSGFHDPVTIGSSSSNSFRSEYSCCQLLSPGSSWLDFRNSITGSSSDGGTGREAVTDRIIHPMGAPKEILSGADDWPAEPVATAALDFTTRDLGAPDRDLIPTPGASGDEYLLVPLTMISYYSPEFIAGQIPDTYWFSAEGSIADNGSVIYAGGDRYRVFASGRYTDPSQWFAVKEA